MRFSIITATVVGLLFGSVLGAATSAEAQVGTSGLCSCIPAPFGFGWYEQPNPAPAPEGNPTMSLGFNTNEAGNPVDPNLPTIYDTWEGNWDQPTGAPWVERHWQYRGADGTFRRPLSLVVPTDTHAPHLGVFGKISVASSEPPHTVRMNLLDAPPGQPSAVMFGTSTVPTFIRCNGKSAGCLQQLSADGTVYVQLAYVDQNNFASFGWGTDGTRFYGTPEPVSGATCEERLDSLISALELVGLVEEQ